MRTVFSGEIVTIRPYTNEDVVALYEAAISSQREIFRYLPWCPPEYSMDDARIWVESRPEVWNSGVDYGFVIQDRKTGRFLGGCGLNQIDRAHQRANLGYWVRTDAAGHGVATEATKLLAHFGFEELGLLRIEIIAAVDNVASRRVAEKARAHFEGILRNRLLLHSKSVDAACYSLVPE